MEALIACMTASGPAWKRPPHIALEEVVLPGPSAIATLSPARLRLALAFYAGLAVLANAAVAGPLPQAEIDRIAGLRAGDMRKLSLDVAGRDHAGLTYMSGDGAPVTLAQSNGRIRLVNFWATWCAPCRQEKPSLDALQATLGGPDFEVIAIATGRNSPKAIARFNAETGVRHLALNTDRDGAAARTMGVMGLPVTVVIDRAGFEIGRLVGGADWNAAEARALVEAVIAAGQ
jgi:thiol-disulfide isomerase/thioredoxin